MGRLELLQPAQQLVVLQVRNLRRRLDVVPPVVMADQLAELRDFSGGGGHAGDLKRQLAGNKMSNDAARMTKEIRMTKDESPSQRLPSSLVLRHFFVIRASAFVIGTRGVVPISAIPAGAPLVQADRRHGGRGQYGQ